MKRLSLFTLLIAFLAPLVLPANAQEKSGVAIASSILLVSDATPTSSFPAQASRPAPGDLAVPGNIFGVYNSGKDISSVGFEFKAAGRAAKHSELLELLTRKNLPELKKWVADNLTDAADSKLITNISKLESVGDLLFKFQEDLVDSNRAAELGKLFKENPNDLGDIWKNLKKDPYFAKELADTSVNGSRWTKWKNSEFFKQVTKKGKDFEEKVCNLAFRDRTAPDYLRLKNLVSTKYRKNLDEYEVFTQVQLKYDGEDYFVADQLFVKYGKNERGQDIVEDMIVIENKLKYETDLTTPQKLASKKTEYTVRSIDAKSSTMNVAKKTFAQGSKLKFSGSIQWVKVWDSDTGEIIKDMAVLP